MGSAAFLAVCGLICAVVPGNTRYVFMSVGGIVLMLALVLLPVMYVMARKFDRALTSLEMNPWIHWQYSAAQWQEWSGIQVERLKAVPATFVLVRDWRQLAWVFASIIGGVLIFSPGRLWEKMLYALSCCAALFIWAELAAWDSRRAPEKYRAKLRHVAPEAYFGHDGLFCNGAFVTWLDISVYLTSASIDARVPRSLLFFFDKIVPNPYGATQATRIVQSVLIPAGGDGDLARLQKELSERCPSARIALS
jgi:drug/metabolite transporter (DMT)-like permease